MSRETIPPLSTEDLARVNDAHALDCPECKAPMRCRNSRFGPFWGCSMWPACDCTHGAHPDGRPLGTPATREVREARKRAHASFDRLWRRSGEDGNKRRRVRCYVWLAREMGLDPDATHIAHFDANQCATVERLVAPFLDGDGVNAARLAATLGAPDFAGPDEGPDRPPPRW